MRGFPVPFRLDLACFLLCAGLALPPRAPALIVHQGGAVPAWPQGPAGEAGSRPLAKSGATGGQGMFPAPKGTLWGVTLLVDFPDQAPAYGAEEVRQWLNARGFAQDGCNGSVRDYYAEVSNGQVDLRNEVYGYYRAKHPKAYYEGGAGFERAGELLTEVLDHFDAEVDFSRFDNDGDGVTESVSLVYAGEGAEWGRGIWPHAGSMHRRMDGVLVGRYMMADLRDRFSLYVFAHEVGHMVFGWPDLHYFGDYCLMGNRPDDANPPAVNDLYRADQGWIPVVDLSAAPPGRHTAPHGSVGFRWTDPERPDELFFWSNFKNDGRRRVLGGSGLLVLHLDRSMRGNTSASSRGIYVVEADGTSDLASSQWPIPGSSGGDFFRAGQAAEFSPATFPAARWHDGSPSGLRIHGISAAGDEMTFHVGPGPAPGTESPTAAGDGHRRPVAGEAGMAGGWRDLRGVLRPGWNPRRILAPGTGL